MTMRARVDRLIGDVGIELTGNLRSDVEALAASLSIPYEGVGPTVSALEKETYGDETPAPAEPAGDGLEARSVKELKALARARGASLVGCVEKADMVAAIRAAPPAPAPPAPPMPAAETPAPAPASGAVRRLTKQMIARVLQAASHYEILGVDAKASAKDIKVAYRDLACLVHPDKCSEEGAAEAFKKVNEAHETLSDDARRAVYDAAQEPDAPAPPPPPPPPPPPSSPRELPVARGGRTTQPRSSA